MILMVGRGWLASRQGSGAVAKNSHLIHRFQAERQTLVWAFDPSDTFNKSTNPPRRPYFLIFPK